MAKLAIKGHATRGKEVIEILEMLGGKNPTKLKGNTINHVYIINSSHYGEIDCLGGVTDIYKVFTLEQFLEKFSYKVGDKVQYTRGIGTITSMKWNVVDNEIQYNVSVDDETWITTTEFLLPHKEQETMEERENSVVVNIENKQLKVHSLRFDKTQLVINDEYELKKENDTYYIVHKQPKYPQTCEECLNVLGKTMNSLDNIKGYKFDVLMKLQQLLICRDAYWKIAGEQMGLGKPWKPELNSKKHKFALSNVGGNISFEVYGEYNSILGFPTEEMRDAFYENFKDLIEECKELL